MFSGDMDVDDSGLRFSEFQYHDSGTPMSIEPDTERERAKTSNIVSEGTCDTLYFNGKKYEELQLEDLNGVAFQNIDEVEKFYNYYALAMGFSVRKQKLDRNVEGLVIRRQLVCSKEGARKLKNPKNSNPKEQKNIPPSRRPTRENCPAAFTVHRCKERGLFYATEFITEHNHILARPEHVRFLRSHRNVTDHDIAQVTALRKVSIKTSQAYEYLVHRAGGYDYVGFTLKDLYNSLDGERREILVDGDAQAAISYMNLKAARDPEFYCIFSVDQEGRLANMFWRDSRSLIDYNSFGEVLILDSTYKTNIYGKPLAVFVGVNNHRATIIFGCALLVDETEETYKWVISSFLASMNGKKPISVITDGDVAMWNAVAHFIPDARHRLCAWHIGKNVCQNVKDVDIQKDLCHLIYAGLTVDEWEAAWHYMVAMYGIENDTWLIGMYNKRERWAEAFFREHFFAGICSTQRCEGMHRNLKGGVGKHRRLCEVLPRMDQVIERIRDRVLEDDFKSINSNPVYGRHMRCLQEQIGKIFTHDIFLLIKDQIGFESKFVVADRVNYENTGFKVFKLAQYGKSERRWSVTYQHNEKNPSYQCSCKLFESDGIPCCHIFSAMKDGMQTIFPKSLVKKRWTKDATVSKTISIPGNYPDKATQLARYGEMMGECAQICYVSSFVNKGYEDTMEALRRLAIKSKTYWTDINQSNEAPIDGLHKNVVRDPVVCRTKGTQPRQPTNDDQGNTQNNGKRGCKKCGQPGHNQRTCKIRSQDSTVGSAGGPKKQRERGGKQTKASNTPHSSNLFCTQDHLATTNNVAGDESTESSGSEDEGVPCKSISQSLIHHKEEARRYNFVVGYDNFGPYHSVGSSHGVLVNSSTNNVPLSYTSGDPEPFTTYQFTSQQTMSSSVPDSDPIAQSTYFR